MPAAFFTILLLIRTDAPTLQRVYVCMPTAVPTPPTSPIFSSHPNASLIYRHYTDTASPRSSPRRAPRGARARLLYVFSPSHTTSSSVLVAASAASAANLLPPGPYCFSRKAANAALSAAFCQVAVGCLCCRTLLPRPPPQLPPPRPRPLKMAPRPPRRATPAQPTSQATDLWSQDASQESDVWSILFKVRGCGAPYSKLRNPAVGSVS